MAIIEVANLYKNYGQVKAVQGVSFSVQKGEIFGILGPNGAGKTTTLEILEGLRSADMGEVKIGGADVLRQPQKVKQIIGVQLQSESFFDNLTLKELLELFGKIYQKKVAAYDLLQKVDLLEKAHTQHKTLSGGQQRRFSIAASLVNQPQVLFLDEPTTGLDPQARRYAWELIKQIRQSGITIVLTTHYMEEAEYLCDRVAVMDHGKIVDIGAPFELIQTVFVKNHITFSSKKFIAHSDLERLYGVTNVAKKENGTYHLETNDPEATLFKLLQESYDQNLGLYNLDLRRPNLEDVFIYLTGHKLRE